MMNLKNNALILALIFMIMLAVHLKMKLIDQQTFGPEETLDASLNHNSILKEDSLCRIWVNDTATRIAFKHWYKKQLNKSK